MAPSRPVHAPSGFQSQSTPNLPTIRSFETTSSSSAVSSNEDVTPTDAPSAQQVSPDTAATPSEPTSIDDFTLDHTTEGSFALSPATSEGDGSGSEEEEGDEDEDEEEEDDGPVPNLPSRPLYYHSSRSSNYLTPSAFAPPFYNRPPTPLPPSPSLTSLLRPNFSSANSRPTTPDPSSDEGIQPPQPGSSSLLPTGTQTPNSAAASTLNSTYRAAKQPIPRASPKVPTYEYYGFTLYLMSSLVFISYLLWALLPEPFLKKLGISYYPDRWWAVALPAWTVMLMLYIYVALAAYNTGYLTLSLGSVECLVDEAASVAVVDAQGRVVRERPSWLGAREKKEGKKSRRGSLSGHKGGKGGLEGLELDWRSLWNEGTDAVMDIPIGGVCEILYGGSGDEDEGDDDVRGNAHDR